MTLSVIVPVHNGSHTICRCLCALLPEHPREIIVVDDGSTDDTARLVQAFPVALVTVAGPGGPARARNLGAAQARGDILVFVDADVEVHAGTLTRISALFASRPELSAVFGSYDNLPAERDPISLYKNLLHHYVHQHGRRLAATFWAGLGAVRRNAYLRLGGLNESYRRPSVEDIDFGYRLGDAGLLCELHPDLQGKHLKHWTLANLVQTDLLDRAIPWTELIFQQKQFSSDLNFGWRHKAGALLALAMLAVLLIVGWRIALFVIPLLTAAFILVHFPLFRFLTERGGLRFLVAAIPLHLIYSLCCVAGFAVGLCTCVLRPLRRKPPLQAAGARNCPTVTKS